MHHGKGAPRRSPKMMIYYRRKIENFANIKGDSCKSDNMASFVYLGSHSMWVNCS